MRKAASDIERLVLWTLVGLALGLGIPAIVFAKGFSVAWLWGVAGALAGMALGVALRRQGPEP